MRTIPKPLEGEYAPYTIAYISKAPDALPMTQFTENARLVIDTLGSLTEEQLLYRYEPGKWNIKEILVHLIDSERVFAYRAMRFARKDATPLPGFEQNDYVPASNASERSLGDIIEEYTAVRKATACLMNSFGDEVWERRGTANGNPCSVRALAYIIIGHELHHMAVIKERYLAQVAAGA